MSFEERPSELVGNFSLNGFHFGQPELSWFGKQVWGRWPAAVQEINQALRQAIEDLSMMRSIRLDYQLMSQGKRVEIFNVCCLGSYQPILQLLLVEESNDSEELFAQPSLEFKDNVWPTVLDWAREHSGGVYQSPDPSGDRDVQFATIFYKLRSALLGVQAKTRGRAAVNEGELVIRLVGAGSWLAVLTLAQPAPAPQRKDDGHPVLTEAPTGPSKDFRQPPLMVDAPQAAAEAPSVLEQVKRLSEDLGVPLHSMPLRPPAVDLTAETLHEQVQEFHTAVAASQEELKRRAETDGQRRVKYDQAFAFYTRTKPNGEITLFALRGNGSAYPVEEEPGWLNKTFLIKGEPVSESDLLDEYVRDYGPATALPLFGGTWERDQLRQRTQATGTAG